MHTTPSAPSDEALIKAKAQSLGFYTCGIARAEAIPASEYTQLELWLKQGKQGEMTYLERHLDLRRDPRLLVPGTETIIMVAMNYYPHIHQPEGMLKVARYAYGRDYHKVIKKRLNQLLAYIQSEIAPECTGRAFADSAPLLERYWAEQAGIGWRGKHGLIIIPRAGSYFVLGALLISLKLEPDTPLPRHCGSCKRCLEACPTKALTSAYSMDARSCISYLTIEQRGEIPEALAPKLGGRLFGCDACQEACPWNRLARPTEVVDFAPRPSILSLTVEGIERMSEEDFERHFAGSPLRRAGLNGLKRTLRALDTNS